MDSITPPRSDLARVPFGKAMREQFSFAQGWRPLNHGSFGAFPKTVQAARRYYQDLSEESPDIFIRMHVPKLLERSRKAVAKLLNVPHDTCVLVPNATTGVATFLTNIDWQPTDHAIVFSTIYGACEKILLSISDQRPFKMTRIQLDYPLSDQVLVDALESTIAKIRDQGENPKVAVFDTIVSQPGVRMPFEALTETCRRLGVLSCIDGAHGIGQIPLDLSALDPDFLTSNAHKWLFVPRGCAVVYVPKRNQHLIRTTIPTSHGYQPKSGTKTNVPSALRPANGVSAFENLFIFIATMDVCQFLCIPEAIQFREQVCGGEEAIMKYISTLAAKGSAIVAQILGTEIMDNPEGTMTGIALGTIRLPIQPDQAGVEPDRLLSWLNQEQLTRYNAFAPVLAHAGALWVRVSAQVYLDEDDFVFIGNALKALCEEAKKGLPSDT